MSFRIGELVVMQNASYYTEWNGSLGVIVAALAPRTSMDLSSMRLCTRASYQVQVLAEDGVIVDARPHQLRPLYGPDTETDTDAENRSPATLKE